jgi:uncharacterized membrane protein YhaH (DUF805 family)
MSDIQAGKRNIYFLLAALAFFAIGIWMARRHDAQTMVWMALGVVFLVLGARKPAGRG